MNNPRRINKSRRRWPANAALLLASLLLCLLLLEAGVRLFADPAPGLRDIAGEGLLWQPDSLLGWAMQPHAHGRFERPEFATTIQTNSLGLRDDELAPQKAEDEIRILLLGDSVVAGFEVERDETLEAVLEAKLNSHHDGVTYQVINAGCRGYGTDQELLYLRERGLALQPDLVLLAFVPANDPENNVTIHTRGRRFAKPYFDYGADSSLVLRGVPVPPQPGDAQQYSPVLPAQAADTSAPVQRPLKRWLRQHVHSYSFLAQRLKNGPPALVALLQRLGLITPNTPPEWVAFYRAPEPPEWRARWQISLDLIAEMQRLCRDHGIPYGVWMFPLKEQVYARDREIFLRTYGLDPREFDFDQPAKRLQRFSDRQGLPFLSPLPRFRELAATGERLHFAVDNHCNAAGHRVLAEAIYPFVLELLSR